MKKIIAALLTLTLCLGLCACGAMPTAKQAEEIVLPTKPQIAVPELPAGANSEEAVENGTGAVDPTGETHPWDVEFNEAGYSRMEGVIDDGADIIVWKENGFYSPTVRQLEYWKDGMIIDRYYYPSGTFSHTYQYDADGTYTEAHYLDNGHIEIEGNNSHMIAGTLVYYKEILPDGSYQESANDENGNPIYHIQQGAKGDYLEMRYSENGTCSTYICNDPAAGTYQEEVHYESGQLMRYVFEDSQTNQYMESEYFEDGSLNFFKSQTPEYTLEEQYDEEGFHTYFYSKDADYEIELTADESGMLVKVIENGSIIEDAATLAQYAASYNFRQ